MSLAVNAPNAAIEQLRLQWAVLEALQGGTPAMRDAGTTLLPQWPGEEDAAWCARRDTATLFPAYRRTVGVMAGKPFAKALSAENVPQPWLDDIDLQGVSLHSFAAEMFAETVGYGLAGLLAEYPRVDAGPLPRTVAQVERAGQRPYLVRVKHDQILGWRTAIVGGRMALTQLRIAESVEVEDGPYGTKTVEQVRVLVPGGWEVWQATGDKGAWVMVDSGRTSLSVIPFVPLYGAREAFMVGAPPLLDLAYLNVKHWQSQSDQDTILHVARVPILVRYGAEGAPLVIGASTAMDMPPTTAGADVKFVEHSGVAIGAGETSLRALEEQMIQTGAELLVKKPGDRSATESANDAEANKSDLQRMAENFEDALDQALALMAQYAGTGKGGSVKLFSDYGAATLSDASATLVKDLHLAGVLSRTTTVEELKRRGVLSAEVDAEEEAARVAEEGPPMALAMEAEARAEADADDPPADE